MRRKEILQEFVEQWDTVKKDGMIALPEFEDYYTDISASIDRDDYFEKLLKESWGFPEQKGPGEKKVHFAADTTKFPA